MTAANFRRALDRVLVYEGGFSNHPKDPGGPTNKGITQRVYDGYRRSKGQPLRSVRDLSTAELREIYKRQYWDKIQGDRLPAGVDFVVFDGAVNSGPSQATKWLQRALRLNQVDGDLGESTVAAANNHPDHDALIADTLRRRLGMLQSLKTWGTFGRGWSARIANCLAIGQAWASGSVGPAPVAAHEHGGDAKALIADVDLPPVSEDAGVKAGAGGTGLAAVVQAAQSQLQPIIGTSQTLNAIYAVLTIAGVAIVVGGVLYSFWAAAKRKRAEKAYGAETIGDLDALEQPA